MSPVPQDFVKRVASDRCDSAGAHAGVQAEYARDDEHNAYDLERRQWFPEPAEANQRDQRRADARPDRVRTLMSIF
jgi:hypothetical protein